VTSDFWRNRRVAITGNTGFKGAWLSHWLLAWGADVNGFALAPETSPNLFTVLELEKRMPTTVADVRNANALAGFLTEVQPEVVLHLAAQSLVRRGYTEPAETYGVNVMGLVHLLDAVRRTPSVRAVVVVTSDKCYEIASPPIAHREADRLGGRDPYSNSKACAELVTAAYRDSYFSSDVGARIATARAGNVIGGGDWAQDRLVPDLVTAIARDREPVLRHPDAIRPWQHVFEPLAGYLTLAEALFSNGTPFAGAWNFGPDPDDARSVGELTTLFAAAAGGKPWILEPSNGGYETQSLRVDSTRARTELGWRPRLTIEEGVVMTAHWYRAFLDGQSMRELSDAQLDSYLAVAC
jgi:CDP-glucose 4,6-dehydratase